MTEVVTELTGSLESMELGEVLTKRFSFDRKSTKGLQRVKLVLRVLSHQEMMLARVAAAANVASMDEKSLAQRSREDWIRSEEDVEVLSRALMRDDDSTKVWAGPATLRKMLQPTEILMLAREYERWSDEVSPVLRGMTAEQFSAITDAITLSQRADPLDFYDWPTVKAYIVTLASQLRASLTDNSSGISEPDEL